MERSCLPRATELVKLDPNPVCNSFTPVSLVMQHPTLTGQPHNARELVAHDTLHEVEMEAQRGLHRNPEASQLRDWARPPLYTHVVCEHHCLHRSHLLQL